MQFHTLHSHLHVPPIDFSALKATESRLRDRADREPESPEARLDLAWWLLAQTLLCSGFAACLKQEAKRGTQVDDLQTELDTSRTIEDMLTECLMHATAVPTVAAGETSRMEAARILELACMLGFSDLVEAAERAHDRKMCAMLRDVETPPRPAQSLRAAPPS